MSVKTTVKERQVFYQRHLAGETYREISASYDLSVGCVRHWCRRQRDGKGCATQWHRAKSEPLSQFEPVVRATILEMRHAHPRWGPATIGVMLRQESALAGVEVPSRASIGRYLHSFREYRRRPRLRIHSEQPAKPSRVHEVWQIDFKTGIALGDGTLVNLHTVRDEVGEACLLARLTPAGMTDGHSGAQHVSVPELQATLRQAFAEWGTLPEKIQTDNEAVFTGYTKDNFPGQLTLWLCGLGIEHSTIRPRRPTDNAEVERCHQTINNFAIVGRQHLSRAQLQTELNQAVEQLLFLFPSQADGCHGQTPAVAHPELLTRPRPWLPERELACFDLQRIDYFMATMTWRRRVGKTGQICLGGHHRYYSVGRAYAQQDVFVRFDPADRTYVFFLPAADAPHRPGPEVGRQPARFLTATDITGLPPNELSDCPHQLAFFLHSPQGVGY
jgi:transposase InsO family protein